jgi:DNA-binding transcriptional MerR regulator
MSLCTLHYRHMPKTEPSLSDLADASGIEPRTLRSWVAQGLLPAPLSRGAGARYPAGTVERLLAIRTMRDLLGMSLSDIRRELLVASPEQVTAFAERGAQPQASTAPRPEPSSALAYLGGLRAKSAAFPAAAATPAKPQVRGFEALEHNLARERSEPARKARAEDWLRIPITPEAELHVRGPLDAEQKTRLERCADLIRDILLGRDT